QLLAIICDNASNNNVMIQKMEEAIDSFLGGRARVRCLCHVVNLVAKSIISVFD
ncbi:uncharacterized protein BXZ73DRAFT_8846, partial [Epithele typhae]|uniref:uncharacterized protein n=1 Tax=Epithele typhae TaxID=378194 RepID=UPI0020081270